MIKEEMCFPETWEEFRKQYRIVDTEEVYTNGVEMIPTFRVEQWLDHISVNCSQNKMEQVAKMFSKKLNEEFTAVVGYEKVKCKFTNDGLKNEFFDSWGVSNTFLGCLITGEAVIVDEQDGTGGIIV